MSEEKRNKGKRFSKSINELNISDVTKKTLSEFEAGDYMSITNGMAE